MHLVYVNLASPKNERLPSQYFNRWVSKDRPNHVVEPGNSTRYPARDGISQELPPARGIVEHLPAKRLKNKTRPNRIQTKELLLVNLNRPSACLLERFPNLDIQIEMTFFERLCKGLSFSTLQAAGNASRGIELLLKSAKAI